MHSFTLSADETNKQKEKNKITPTTNYQIQQVALENVKTLRIIFSSVNSKSYIYTSSLLHLDFDNLLPLRLSSDRVDIPIHNDIKGR